MLNDNPGSTFKILEKKQKTKASTSEQISDKLVDNYGKKK